MGPEGEGRGAGLGAPRGLVRRNEEEEEAESSGGEEQPGDFHEWGAVEGAGSPDFLAWWVGVGVGQWQGPGMEAEEGGRRDSLWTEELGAELSRVGEAAAAEEAALHHGMGVEAVLGGGYVNQQGL